MKKVLIMLVVAVFAAGLLTACSGRSSSDNGVPAEPAPTGDTQGKVLAMISASTAPDSDGDYLPDDVEAYLGTNPQDRDKNHDGIPDFVEIFGTG